METNYPPIADEDTPKLPRYVEIADELRFEILSRKYMEPGSFPTEAQLCKRFDCARFTVREGLKKLSDERLISRKHGAGTTVNPQSIRNYPLRQRFGSLDELLQYANGTLVSFKKRKAAAIPKIISDHIGVETPGLWFPFFGTRVKVGQSVPISYTVAWLHPDLEHVIPKIQDSDRTIFNQIEALEGLKVLRITQDIQAIVARPYISRKLGLEDGEPTLRVLRCYYDNSNRLFEISASYHPGERFTYSVTLTT